MDLENRPMDCLCEYLVFENVSGTPPRHGGGGHASPPFFAIISGFLMLRATKLEHGEKGLCRRGLVRGLLGKLCGEVFPDGC